MRIDWLKARQTPPRSIAPKIAITLVTPPSMNMKTIRRLLLGVCIAITLQLRADATMPDAGNPMPEVPAAGAVVYAPHPHFRWHREADVRIDEVHHIQIARDETFKDIACEDWLEVVSRFVPVKPLVPGHYWWRVRRGEGAWSPALSFEVREPEHIYTVPLGSKEEAVRRIMEEAAAHTPARVNFEAGEYAFTPQEGKSLITLEKVDDLIVDGNGSRLVLGGSLLKLVDCRRVTIRNFTVTASRPGHTLVRIVSKDPAKGLLVVKPEPGYDPDVPFYFQSGKNGGSLMGCMDTEHRGRYLPGAGISAHSAHPPQVAPVPGEPGAYSFCPVDPATLGRCPIGAPAIVTTYRWSWVEIVRGEEFTLSQVTVSDLPGAITGGSCSAKSYLACRVKCPTPQGYFGGHSACGSGRIGEWIEGCEFECLADDGPAEQSTRMAITALDGTDALLIGGGIGYTSPRSGDRVTLFPKDALRGGSATVVSVTNAPQGVRVQLDHSVAELEAAMGRKSPGNWKGVRLYIDSQSNEDFVYRHNNHLGGRGHGVKFNGTRGWIAESTFENINGNAVMSGYISDWSGHGASDVVISSNKITRCGWTPISCTSESRLGKNLIIRNNRISEIRDAAIYIKGYTDVSITGNEFSSVEAPSQGAWIVCQDSTGILCKSNRFDERVQEIKEK